MKTMITKGHEWNQHHQDSNNNYRNRPLWRRTCSRSQYLRTLLSLGIASTVIVTWLLVCFIPISSPKKTTTIIASEQQQPSTTTTTTTTTNDIVSVDSFHRIEDFQINKKELPPVSSSKTAPTSTSAAARYHHEDHDAQNTSNHRQHAAGSKEEENKLHPLWPIRTRKNLTKEEKSIIMKGRCDALLGNGTRTTYRLCDPSTITKTIRNPLEEIRTNTTTTTSASTSYNNNNNNHDDDEDRGNSRATTTTTTTSMLECHYNPTTVSSFCQARNIIMDPSKIDVSIGGQQIVQVIGRDENLEIPKYDDGAFQLLSQSCRLNFDDITREKLPYHLVDIMESVEQQQQQQPQYDGGGGGGDNENEAQQQKQQQPLLGRLFGSGFQENIVCNSWEEKPTLLVTRYEYANLYHTYTDWYSAYQAAMLALDGNETLLDEVNIIFLDGHAQGALDSGWEILFPNADISYISDYQKKSAHNSNNNNKWGDSSSGGGGDVVPVCFRHAIFVPPGYRAPLSVDALDNRYVTPIPANYLDKCAGNAWHVNFRDRLIKNSIHRLVQSKAWLFQHLEEDMTQKKLKEEEQEDSNEGKKNNLGMSSRHHHNHHHLSLLNLKKYQHNLHPNNDNDDFGEVPIVKVLFILRKDYIAHPRTNGKVTRRIENEEALLTIMKGYGPPNKQKEEEEKEAKRKAPPQQEQQHVAGTYQNETYLDEQHKKGYQFGNHTAFVDVREMVLEKHDVAEQMIMIQQANVVIGMHGAGLTHIVLSRPGTLLLELLPPSHGSMLHFRLLCRLAGCVHKPYYLSVYAPVKETDPYRVPEGEFEIAFQRSISAFLRVHHQQEDDENNKGKEGGKQQQHHRRHRRRGHDSKAQPPPKKKTAQHDANHNIRKEDDKKKHDLLSNIDDDVLGKV